MALIKRSYKMHCKHRPKRPLRIPITVWVLQACLRFLSDDDVTLFALCCVGVFGLFRRGELTYKGPKAGILRRPAT